MSQQTEIEYQIAKEQLRLFVASLEGSGLLGLPLDLIREARAELDRLELHYVQLNREAGQSWERIAQRLGVTRSAAWQRYANH